MERDRVDISVDGDSRPVTCKCCGRKMYYGGHAKHEPEVTVLVEGPAGLKDQFYAHVRCWSYAMGRIVGVSG
jgi:hypothetical protein